MPRHPMPDVIVVLPGIMGSVLRKHGDVVWGFSPGSIARALFTRGDSIAKGLLLQGDDEERETLDDGVTADELLPDLHLLPGFWKIDGYSRLCEMIEARFEVRLGENYFHFPYDWRRSNRAAARRLQRRADAWLKRWRDAGHPQARLILLAHSMGGLVSRHYLEVLEGWRDTRALITFGTPYRGAPKALDTLANGLRKGPLVFEDLTRFVRSCTSVYQLLPIYPSLAGSDATLRRVGEVGALPAPPVLPGVDPARAAAALAFHDQIRHAVDAHLGERDYADGRYRLFPVSGINQETLQSSRLEAGRILSFNELNGQDLGGDGTVPRVSAIPHEYSNASGAMFTATLHGALQNADAVLQHVEGTITSLYIDLGQYLAPERRVPLSLKVPDLLFDDEAVPVRVVADEGGRVLRARLVDSVGGRVVAAADLKDRRDGAYDCEFAPLPAGSYRVEVDGDAVVPIADALAVGERA